MKINQVKNTNFGSTGAFFKNLQKNAADKFAKIEQIGEGTNIGLDFIGKAAIVPVVIMAASKEDEETKEYSALKNPVAAVIQLCLEVPVLFAGSNLIGSYANKGKLDKEGSGFSYNEKKYQDIFVSEAQNLLEKDKNFKEAAPELLEKLNKKGIGKNLREDFIKAASDAPEEISKNFVKSLDELDNVHKRLYHLQNRVCFLAAIILTPLLCMAENYLHPKIMNMIRKPAENAPKQRMITFHNFKHIIIRKGAHK